MPVVLYGPRELTEEWVLRLLYGPTQLSKKYSQLSCMGPGIYKSCATEIVAWAHTTI